MNTNSVETEERWEELGKDWSEPFIEFGDLGFEELDAFGQQLQRRSQFLFNKSVMGVVKPAGGVELVTERSGAKDITEQVRGPHQQRLELALLR